MDQEKCPLCPTEFSSSAALESHVREAHLQTAVGIKCDQCGYKSPDADELKMHKAQVHDGGRSEAEERPGG